MDELHDHEIAGIFPLLEGDEFNELAEDIKEHGCQTPIVLYEGKILDGRNRYRACKKVGAHFATNFYTGDSPTSHVISLNLKRRHLTPSQAAAAAVEALPFFEKEAKTRQIRKPGNSVRENSPSQKGRAREKAAHTVHVSGRTVQDAKAIKEQSPEIFDQVRSGKKTIHKAMKEIKAGKEAADLKKHSTKISAAASKELESVCDLRVCSCKELFASGIKPDAVITDPPYPKEFLPVFSELAQACHAAKVPLVAVMSGQSYLPEVMRRLCEHLTYRWTLTYLTPGGQAVHQWQAKINTFWKPVLLFGRAADWLGDVSQSAVNDNDKRFHGWGQSESGMADLVERLTKPGQTVCDPFCGGGATAFVSLALGRKFIGCDIDKACIATTHERLTAHYATRKP